MSEEGGMGMKPDDRIEQVGMDVSMVYEKDNGWSLEDVHTENQGSNIGDIE